MRGEQLSSLPETRSLHSPEADSGQVLLDGEIFRESHVIPGIIKQRHARLFTDRFEFYKEGTTTNPSKTWTLKRSCRVSNVRQRKFSLLGKHKSYSLWAHVRGSYEERELFTFTFKYHHRLKDTGHVALGFEDEAVARQWQAVFKRSLAALQQKTAPRDAADLNGKPQLSEASGTSTLGRRSPSNASDLSSPVPCHTRIDRTYSVQSAMENPSLAQGLHQRDATDSLEALVDLAPDPDSAAVWEAWYSKDGVTASFGAGEANDDVLLLSFTVHAPPRLVAKYVGPMLLAWAWAYGPLSCWDAGSNAPRLAIALVCVPSQCVGEPLAIQPGLWAIGHLRNSVLLQNDYERGGTKIGLHSPTVVERVDPHCTILLYQWAPLGWASLFLAPRQLVLQRTWREEDDGTVVVLLTSCRHPGAPEPQHAWWQWYAPIRGKFMSSGYTLAPLLPRFSGGSRESVETLVTHVIKVDMGGWLSSSLFSFASGSALLWTWAWRSWVMPMMNRNIMLRTRAESDRFVSRPFLMGSRDHVFKRPPPLDLPPDAPPPDRATSWAGASPSGRSSIFVTPQMLQAAALREEDDEVEVRAEAAVPGEGDPPTERGTLPPQFWSCPGSAGFKVRGATYLKDRKKVPGCEPLFALAAVDLVTLNAPTPHIARILPSLAASRAPFTFLVQIMVPAQPPLSLTLSWAAPNPAPAAPPVLDGAPPGAGVGDLPAAPHDPFDLALARFLAGGASKEADARRNATFKLIPRITEGSWIIKQSVGSTPCLLGNKLKTYYHQGPGYMEVDVDVASSSVAASVVGMVQGATRGLVIDLAIVLEGHTGDELPESLLGTVRLDHLDLSVAQHLDADTRTLAPTPPPGHRRTPSASRKPAKAA